MTAIDGISPLYDGKPADNDRLEKELQTYDLLDRLGIPYQRMDHYEAATTEVCYPIEDILGVEISKNLFLCNGSRTDYYLLILPGHKKFITREVSKKLGISRLSFGSAEDMASYLNLTPGSVTILGLTYDPERKVRLLIDREVAESEYFGCHPMINTSSLRVRTADILDRFLSYTGHVPTILDL